MSEGGQSGKTLKDHIDRGQGNDEVIEVSSRDEGTHNRSSFWDDTDKELEEAMIAYDAIKSEEHPNQPLFIDIIIRLMIARGYAKNQNCKVSTAGKLLEAAFEMLELVADSDHLDRSHLMAVFECHAKQRNKSILYIETDAKLRYGADPYPKEILM